MDSPADILGPGGRIAARLKNYENRSQQLAMAAAVAAAIEKPGHLVVEAGTGVGKSFAYLVPAIFASAPATEDEPGRRIIISTHTISLQEQLMQKDLPLLRSVMPVEFSAVLVKGRGNYISLRRLDGALARAASLFSEDEHFAQLRQLAAWAKESGDGSLSDLDFRPHPAVWDEVASDHGNCMGRSCPRYKDCFYYQARRRAQPCPNPRRQPRPVLHRSGLAAAEGQHPAQVRRGDLRRSPQRWRPSPATTWGFRSATRRSNSRCGGSTTSGPIAGCWSTIACARRSD